MRRLPIIWMTAFFSPCVSVAPTAMAQPATQTSPAKPQLSTELKMSALRAIKDRLSKAYIFPDRVPDILQELETSAPLYKSNDPATFAQQVTAVLQQAGQDTHLYLNFEPEWYQAAILPPDPDAISAANAYEARHARNFNHGLVETRLLPGNVRYLKIVGFFWNQGEAAPAFDAAMRFLKGGRAIIIDLRSNQGGDTDALAYLRSHFFAPDDLMTTFVTQGSPDVQVRSQLSLPAGRLTGIPLYVLINHRSRSAAEAFAYSIAQFKLGELVGEQTEGAAHFSDDTAVPPYFRLSVPVGYTQDPISKSDWEATGVAPTILVPAHQAFETAYGHALSRLLPLTAEGVEKDFLVWAREGLAAERTHYAPTPADLLAFTGPYGSMAIEFRDGALWLIRTGRDPIRLKPLGAGGLFEADDDDTVRVKIGSKGLDVLRPGTALNQHYAK